MKELIPILKLFKTQRRFLFLSIFLSVITLLASIGLLSLSGWFITACALVGLSPMSAQNFNYMLPAGAVRGFSILRTFSRWAERVISHDATFRILEELRVHFFKKLAPHYHSIRRRFSNGALLNLLVSDIDMMDQLFLRLISPLLSSLFLIAGITLFTCYFDFITGLILGFSLLGFLILIPILFYFLGKNPGHVLARTQMQYRNRIVDWLDNQSELVVFGKEKRFYKKMHEEECALYLAQKKLNQISAFSDGILILLNGWLLLLILWITTDGIDAQAPDPLIALFVFITLAGVELLAPVSLAFQYLGQILVCAGRLNEITQKKPDILFPEKSKSVTDGSICFDNISFSYPDDLSRQAIFTQFTLKIAAKEKIAILGKSGSGKSTLFKLLLRDFNPTKGAIYLDDERIENYSEKALFSAITVIEQETDIFSDTLRNNLRIANSWATNAQMTETLKKVELAYLLNTHAGLDLWLGKGGRELSGGEKRRIGIARALLRPSPVLLLDEPTEALDRFLEERIMELLLKYAEDKTLIYITHRRTGLDRMDKIYRI